jgi:hypothetical protein
VDFISRRNVIAAPPRIGRALLRVHRISAPNPGRRGDRVIPLRDVLLRRFAPAWTKDARESHLVENCRRGSLRSHSLLIVCVALLLLISGCGYHLSGNPDNEPGYQWHGLYRDDVKTVAVPIFGNRTFVQGAEFKLTKAVIGDIEGQTPYKVVPKERADTVLECDIVNTRTVTLSNNHGSAVPMEQMFVFIVRFTWRDLRTGKILLKRDGFEQTSPYYPTLGEDQWVGQQLNIERLALAIVQEMQADWGTKDTRGPVEK